MKKFHFLAGFPTVLAVFLLCVAPADARKTELEKPGETKDPGSERYRNLELFQKVLHFVENNYVEDTKNNQLVQGAIKGMLETLDPHSNFLPADIYKEMKVDTSGEFGGLGLEIGVRDGVLTVITPIEDTPAWKAGVKAGDRIVKVNGESTKGLTLSQAVSKMRGKKGQAVELTLFRKGSEKFKTVKVARETVKLKSVKKEWLDNGFGYIRLTNFSETAAHDVEDALKDFESKQPVRGLVFDLRNNPGGLLDQAVDVASLFVDDGVIVSTVGRNKEQKDVRHAKRGKARKDFPLAILVNGNTASAAEIVSGSMQDLKRGIVLGQRSFGKGSVQTVIDLGEDMGLKLTIARYYTASGRSIQEQGVMPDILLEEYDPLLLRKARVKRDVVREKDLPGHIAGKDSPQKKAEEYSIKELELLKPEKPGKSDPEGASDSEESDSEYSPVAIEPKKDFEVQQALNYLKSYEVLKAKFFAEPGSGTGEGTSKQSAELNELKNKANHRQ
jgi:carboxyl-terminal processing protease